MESGTALAVPVEPCMSPIIIYYLECERLYYSNQMTWDPNSIGKTGKFSE